MKPDQVIGVGIDGSRACDAFGSRPADRLPRHAMDRLRQGGRDRGQDCWSPRSRTTRRCPRRPSCRRTSSTPTTSGSSRTRSATSSRSSILLKGSADAMTARLCNAGVERRAPLLALRGVSKRFGVVQALSDVDLDVHAGEVLALVGENGAGKSTMMRIVEGVVSPDAGSLAFDGVRSGSAAGRRCPCARRPGHPSGARHRPGPVGRREPLHRRPAPDRGLVPRPARPRAAHPRAVRSLRAAREPLALDASRRSRRGAAPTCRDHAGAAGGRPPACARRADLLADRGGDAAPVRDRPPAEGCGRRHRLHLAPDARDPASWPTGSPCCATAAWSRCSPPADLDDGAILSHMVGRPIGNLFDRAPSRRRARWCWRSKASRPAASAT